jgi:hypothetical protein
VLLALPDGYEDVEPSFFHRAHEELPTASGEGTTVRWLFPAPPEAPAGMPMTTPIHGAQLVVGANADEVRVGKRKAWLEHDEPFLGWQILRPLLHGAARAVHPGSRWRRRGVDLR